MGQLQLGNAYVSYKCFITNNVWLESNLVASFAIMETYDHNSIFTGFLEVN